MTNKNPEKPTRGTPHGEPAPVEATPVDPASLDRDLPVAGRRPASAKTTPESPATAAEPSGAERAPTEPGADDPGADDPGATAESPSEAAGAAPSTGADAPTVPIKRPGARRRKAEPDPAIERDDEDTTRLVMPETPALDPADDGETQRLVMPLSTAEPHAAEPHADEPHADESAADDEATTRLIMPASAAGDAAAAGPGGAAAEDAGRDDAVSPDAVNARAGAGHETGGDAAAAPEKSEEPPTGPAPGDGAEAPTKPAARKGRSKISSAGALIGVLLALFGFTLVVQLRSNNTNDGLASARQEDLVRILSDLESRDTRLQLEITALESSQRQLTSGVAGRQAARAEADKRADELGLLAGTMAGRGPGLRITMVGVKASAVLNAVQELRGAGGEVMEMHGAGGAPVRIVASTYFVDAQEGGIAVDGSRLTGPFELLAIGPAQTMETALRIPGGVVASVEGAGGSVNINQVAVVEVTAVRKATTLQYARPTS